jgi:urocanate hydratase
MHFRFKHRQYVTINLRMLSHSSSESFQPDVLRAYTALAQLRPEWGGGLILSTGLSPAGTVLPLASNIAGAVSLSIDQNPDRMRDVVRSGVVDFVVHSLDEAIRAMKNEVRKRAPLSVALNAPPIETLEEVLARGLAPQLFANFLPWQPRISNAAEKLRSLGAELVHFAARSTASASAGFRSGASIVEPLLLSRSWRLRTYSFQTSSELRRFDTLALDRLAADDRLRRRWLEAAPRILQRQRPPQRCLWVSPAEEAALAPAVKDK